MEDWTGHSARALDGHGKLYMCGMSITAYKRNLRVKVDEALAGKFR